jgi:hypothetical protein
MAHSMLEASLKAASKSALDAGNPMLFLINSKQFTTIGTDERSMPALLHAFFLASRSENKVVKAATLPFNTRHS